MTYCRWDRETGDYLADGEPCRVDEYGDPTAQLPGVTDGQRLSLIAAIGRAVSCSWVDVTALCEPVPRRVLARPCQEHA